MKTLYESILDVDDDSLDQRTYNIRRQEFDAGTYLKSDLRGTPTGYDIDFDKMTISIKENMESFAGYGNRPSFSKMGFKKIDCKGHLLSYVCPEDAELVYDCPVLTIIDRGIGNKTLNVNISKQQKIGSVKFAAPLNGHHDQISGKVELFGDGMINVNCSLGSKKALEKLESNCETLCIRGTGAYYQGQLDQAFRRYREKDERGRTTMRFLDIPNEVVEQFFPKMKNVIEIDKDRYTTLYKKLKGGWKSAKD